MTLDDQEEYKSLLKNNQFMLQGLALYSPIYHSVHKSCQASPTWAKYVFLKALYDNKATPCLDRQMQGIFGSLEIQDFEMDYHTYYHLELVRIKKRKADNQLQRSGSEASGGAQTPPAAMDQPLTRRDLERLETRLKAYIDDHIKNTLESIVEACAEHNERIIVTTEQMSLAIGKIRQLEEDQTEYFNAIEAKIDRVANAVRPAKFEHDEI